MVVPPLNGFTFVSNYQIFNTFLFRNRILKLGEGGYASEKYIDSVLILLEKQDNDALYLEDKEYDFNFEFMIPSDLPSSFQTSFGQIEYFLTGVIDRDW